MFEDDAEAYDLLIPRYAGERHQVVEFMVAQAFHFLVHCVFPLIVLRRIDCILVLDGDCDGILLP